MCNSLIGLLSKLPEILSCIRNYILYSLGSWSCLFGTYIHLLSIERFWHILIFLSWIFASLNMFKILSLSQLKSAIALPKKDILRLVMKYNFPISHLNSLLYKLHSTKGLAMKSALATVRIYALYKIKVFLLMMVCFILWFSDFNLETL